VGTSGRGLPAAFLQSATAGPLGPGVTHAGRCGDTGVDCVAKKNCSLDGTRSWIQGEGEPAVENEKGSRKRDSNPVAVVRVMVSSRDANSSLEIWEEGEGCDGPIVVPLPSETGGNLGKLGLGRPASWSGKKSIEIHGWAARGWPKAGIPYSRRSQLP
jgi:hypothetical protein